MVKATGFSNITPAYGGQFKLAGNGQGFRLLHYTLQDPIRFNMETCLKLTLGRRGFEDFSYILKMLVLNKY